jgi:hypothetical protein
MIVFAIETSTIGDVQDSITVATPPAGENLEGANSSFTKGTDEGDLMDESLEADSLDEGEESEDEGMMDD